MPKTLTCKKCGCEVPVSAICPQCGNKLNPGQAHLLWRQKRVPALDWMCWNAVARVVLPVTMVILFAITVMELLMGGPAGLEKLLREVLPITGVSLACIAALTLVVLLLRGNEVIECVADARGVTLRAYLCDAKPLQLYLRLKSPDALDKPGAARWLLVSARSITWKEVARVQIWYEKHMILFYAPRWWQRVCMPGDPGTWAELKALIREKLGRSKKVVLPPELRAPDRPRVKAPRANQHPEPFSTATDQAQNQ